MFVSMFLCSYFADGPVIVHVNGENVTLTDHLKVVGLHTDAHNAVLHDLDHARRVLVEREDAWARHSDSLTKENKILRRAGKWLSIIYIITALTLCVRAVRNGDVFAYRAYLVSCAAAGAVAGWNIADLWDLRRRETSGQ